MTWETPVRALSVWPPGKVRHRAAAKGGTAHRRGMVLRCGCAAKAHSNTNRHSCKAEESRLSARLIRSIRRNKWSVGRQGFALATPAISCPASRPSVAGPPGATGAR